MAADSDANARAQSQSRPRPGSGSRPPVPDPPADVRDLRLASFDELDRIFARGAVPSAGELDGAYGGRLLAVAGTDALAAPVRLLLDAVYGAPSPLMPWLGKRFDTTTDEGRVGSNIWLTHAGPHFAAYKVTDADGTCVLDYDVTHNLPPLRRIRGEVVRLAPGLYLGRMGLRLGDTTPTLLYFALETG